MDRRQFLGHASGFLFLGTSKTVRSNLAPIAKQTISVRTYGAMGDGRTDDTDAFSRAIRALGTSGGTLNVPKGDYRINPRVGIVLNSGLRLMLEPAAILRAIPVADEKYAI